MVTIKNIGDMKRGLIALLLVSLFGMGAWAQNPETVRRLRQHAFLLASDSLQGRKTGTASADKAAAYICSQLAEMGAPSYTDSSYYFPFTYKGGKKGKNVMAIIPGSDPKLKDEYLVIGAHYDHIGVKSGGRADEDTIFNGADDNASGTSALLEITRSLLAHPERLKRSVLIAFFDAEEVGLEGSSYLADHCVVPFDKVRLMMSIDMVGYLRTSGYLEFMGHGTIAEGRRFLASVPWEAPYGKIRLKKFETAIFTATDTRHFAELGCPTLAVSTGLKSPYHKVNDEAEGLDLEGLSYITDYLSALIVQAASKESFAASGELASIHQPHQENNSMVRFGMMLQGGSSHLQLPESDLSGDRRLSYGLLAECRLRPSERWEFGLGAGYRSTGSGYSHTSSFRTHAVEIPLRIQRNATTVSLSSRLNLSFGYYMAPYYRYVFAGRTNSRQAAETASWDNLLQRHQYGLALGMNLRINDFLIEYRYAFDLNPAFASGFQSDYGKAFGRTFSMGVGWLF